MGAQGVSHWIRIQACVVPLLCLSGALSAASDSTRNYYETLRVEPSATGSHIKKAFRQLAIKYHPDKNKSADAEKTFREIAEAYVVLSNKDKRRLYDSVGHEAFLKNEASADPQEDHETSFPFGFEDLFHDFDGSPFVEEPNSHWSFHHNGDDEDGPFGHFPFEEPGFSFYFGDEDEEDHFY